MRARKQVTPGTRLRIAMVGTRGVPAAYGGFETAVEEIGARLASEGADVIVYCRRTKGRRRSEYRGMRLVHLPAIRSKALETLSHTALSILHLITRRKPSVVFLFNAANSPFLPVLRLAKIPTGVHVDGLEWLRGKWGALGRRYYRLAESLAVRWADALIADARGISDYYREEFGVPSELLTYGADIQEDSKSDKLPELGLVPGEFHLVVARFEPENHVDVMVEGFVSSSASHPLVVVGSAPYAADYTDRIAALASADHRVRMLGGVWDQNQLDQLYANALTYLHGHSVGGTNPSLLRAMGAATAVVAWDVNFNREVLGDGAAFFDDARGVREAVESAELKPVDQERRGIALRARAAEFYVWDSVALGYEKLAKRLVGGYSTAGTLGKRLRAGERTISG